MISDLPHDLESEILSRVPAKSLVRLKTTCKRWYGLFRDPRFIENNKKLGKSVMESMLLLNSRVYSIDEDLHSLHNRDVNPKPIYFPGTLCSLKHSSKYLKIFHIYHCEGLMLCTTKGNTRLMVWNPCTGQKRRIKPRTCYRSEDRHAMGYVVNRKSSSSRLSYKILRFCNYKNDQKVQVAEFDMYELSSHSWRVHDHLTHDYEIYSHGVSLKGNTYWVAKDEETGFFMLKFDFTTERFVRLPFPFQSFDFIEEFAVLSVVRDEKLSLLHYLQWSNVMKIWVTNKIDKEAKDLSWRSDFTLVLNLNKFSCVTNVSSFLLDEENKVAICCDVDIGNKCNKTIIYVVGEDMYENVYKEIPEKDSIAKALGERLQHVDWPLVLTYVPSLVHIEKKTSKRRKKRRLALE